MKELTTIKAHTAVYTALKALLTVYESLFFNAVKTWCFQIHFVVFFKDYYETIKKTKNKDTFHKQLSSCLFKLSGQKQKKGEG